MKKNLKRIFSVPLTMTLVVTMLVPFRPVVVKAEGGSAPSASVYASREDLQNKYDLDGTDDVIGKIKYGSSYDDDLYWYIAGKDSSIEGNNVTLFSTNCIFNDGSTFNNITEGEGYRNFSYEANTGYGEAEGSIDVDELHYGASDIRRELVNVRNEYFSEVERSVMNRTEITLKDYMNNRDYTLNDYLYLATICKENDSSIEVGGTTGNAIEIDNDYWGESRGGMWLRYTKAIEAGAYYYADSASESDDEKIWTTTSRMYYEKGVYPALNINLENIPFASAVPVGASVSGTIDADEDTTMTFRMTPSESIGGVYYGDDLIIAASSDANTPVNLIVQGKDATIGDWYYVKSVTEREIITANTIKTAMNLTNDVALTDCGVWIEKATNGIAYASVGLYSNNIILINAITLNDFDTQAGKAFDTEVMCETLGIPTSASNIKYEVDGVDVTSNIAASNTTYTAKIPLKVLTGARGLYFFDGTVTATVNGNVATVTRIDDYNVIVNYQFTTGNFVYDIIEGKDGKVDKNSESGITITGNGDISEFEAVKVDGQVVDSKNYTISESASSVTLLKAYIDILSVGTHTFEMVWEGGSASTSFTVNEKTADEEESTEVDEEESAEADEEESTEADDEDSDGFDAGEDSEEGTKAEEESTEDVDDTVKAPVTGDDMPVVTLFILLIVSGASVLVAKKAKKIEN